MPTTSNGIEYPASGSHTRLWEHFETMAEDVDGLVTSLSGGWQAYTPAWTSSGTQPVLNNGTLVGRYSKTGTIVRASARLLMGSTTTYGTGGYLISLPVAAATTSSLFRVGSAYCRDASATSSGHFPAICVIDTGTPTLVAFFNVIAQVGQTVPFTWANTDHLSFTITYESAS
jgi:hypothetical protein